MHSRVIKDFTELFKWQASLLEELLPIGWFDRPHPEHRAFRRWELCRALHASGGKMPIGVPQAVHQEVVSAFLDSVWFSFLSESDLASYQVGSFSDYGDDKFRRFRESRAAHEQGFDDLMTELSYGAWHKWQGAVVQPLEEEGKADLIARLAQPGGGALVAECKRLTVMNSNRIDAIVKKASRQIRETDALVPGVLVVDVTAAIGGLERASQSEVGDELELAFTEAIRGEKNRSVSTVVLFWDHHEYVQSDDGRIESLLQRRWQQLDHGAPANPLPLDAKVFEGASVYVDVFPEAPGIRSVRPT